MKNQILIAFPVLRSLCVAGCAFVACVPRVASAQNATNQAPNLITNPPTIAGVGTGLSGSTGAIAVTDAGACYAILRDLTRFYALPGKIREVRPSRTKSDL